MHRAAIAYGNVELEARERDDVWTVRLADQETRARYLDVALADLLGSATDAHRAAARLLAEPVELGEQQDAPHPNTPGAQRRKTSAHGHQTWATPLVFGLSLLGFAVVASTTFMLTTWLSTLR